MGRSQDGSAAMIYTNHITGVNVYDIEQGTEEWRMHRLGVVTASRAHDIIKGGRGGKPSEARATYMLELIAQVCTGIVPESASFKQAEWGHENEPLAREAYEAMEFVSVNQCGLIYRDESLRCAISPDGILEDRGLEIKNPFTSQVHIATLLDGKIKPEYVTQCQYSLWVTGLDRWDFVSFDWRIRGKPENRLVVVPILRDECVMRKFDEEIPKFICDMDEALSSLGFLYGDQWRGL